ncbi:MAG: beta-ketoacyl synthase chain length factor [Ferruginibacter sp.]|nr:beta-ketoacyl synthase chain length factor [Ferruginibacter sp.]
MFYIHQTTCISPQQTFGEVNIKVLNQPAGHQLKVIEPTYGGIPPGVLRRMSKAVRTGVGAAIPFFNQSPIPDGIIIGTANAGLEECFHFLKQIVDYNEGLLSPGSFVQSTPNAVAAQIGMLGRNKGYNITHVHLGLAFENAMTDAGMMIKEHPANNYLLGAVDDISLYNHTLNLLAGWFKAEAFAAGELYELNSPGSIAGEGAAMFLVNGNPVNAIAQLQAVGTVHADDVVTIEQQLKHFLHRHLPAGEKIDVLISGENGDNRLQKYYASCEKIMSDEAGILRFKHMCGEYPTASAMALWLACHIFQKNPIPRHMVKKNLPQKEFKNILIYNCYKGAQHSFMLVAPG